MKLDDETITKAECIQLAIRFWILVIVLTY